jgi:hypothetical protein
MATQSCCSAPSASPARRSCGGGACGRRAAAREALFQLPEALLEPAQLRPQRHQLRGVPCGGRLRCEPLLDGSAEQLGELVGRHHLAERAGPRFDAVIDEPLPLGHHVWSDRRPSQDLRPVFEDGVGRHRYRLLREPDVATWLADRAASQPDTRGQHFCRAPRPAINEMLPPGSSMYSLSELPTASMIARTHAGGAM